MLYVARQTPTSFLKCCVAEQTLTSFLSATPTPPTPHPTAPHPPTRPSTPAPPTPPRAMSICRTCKTLMSDLQDVLTRKVDSFLSRQVLISLLVLQVEWAGYRQKGHVHAVLDTLCLELPMRYPSSKALRKMQVDYSAILKSLRLCYKNSVYSVMCMFFSLFSLCICP